ncbi:MAG: A/G-specific adenine glycosylase [Caedibacter sp. 37-49]|nr:MAG: A/G-specific adenine glycosylase [Caedibacter sp. 37-49]
MRKHHKALLNWYDLKGRDLPWRAKGNQKTNPYHVWLSEIMLQQTTVVTVIPYFLSFIKKWPTVQALAQASLDDILHAWQGLGYYTRARNLYLCAKEIVNDYNSQFPCSSSELIKLPGIGPYTSKAIAAIAFNEQVLPIDGNIARILARLYAISTPLPEGMISIQNAAFEFTPELRPGDFAQAMMDLGASLCTSRSPVCLECPFRLICKAYAVGTQAGLPVKSKKPIRPKKYAVAYILKREDGAILLRKRPENGLLGGMMEIPTSKWSTTKLKMNDVPKNAPIAIDWESSSIEIKHSFTHFDLEIMIYSGNISMEKSQALEGFWVFPHQIGNYALPTLFKKIIEPSLKLIETH